MPQESFLAETMMCLANYMLSQLYQPTFIDVSVKAGGGNFEHTLNELHVVFVITVNVS